MTESLTRTRQLTVTQIVTKAYRLAGLVEATMHPDAAQLNEGAATLDLICDELATEGLMAKTGEEREVTLLAGTQDYTLPADILDIETNGRMTLTGETNEHTVLLVDRDRWEAIGDKTETGRPTQMYVYRAGEQLELRFWPVPTAADVGTVRVIAHRLRGDTAPSTTVTPGFERYWNMFLIHELANYLSHEAGMNPGRIALLARKAAEYKSRAMMIARPQGNRKFKFRHRTGWSR